MSENLKIFDDGRILVKNVVLAYPHVVTPWALNASDAKRYGVVAILSNKTHAKEIKQLREHIGQFIKDNKMPKIPSANKFLRDGDESGKTAFENAWTISASDKLDRPPVIRIKGEKMSREDDRDELESFEVSGVVADILIRPWKQDNSYGKKVNANLLAVNFKKIGEALDLGGGVGDTDDVWEDDDDLDDDEDDV